MLTPMLRTEKLFSRLENRQHIVWDWNGTLLSDVPHAIESMNRLLIDHGLPKLEFHKYQSLFEFPIRKYYDSLGFDYSKEAFESLCHRFVDHFMAGFTELPLVDAMEPLLRKFHLKGIKQSLLSATDQKNLDHMINHFKLGDIFLHVHGIDNKFAESKLARGQELLSKVNVPKSQTVLVGDTLHDLEVGQALGIDVVLVSHGHQSFEKLQKYHADVV